MYVDPLARARPRGRLTRSAVMALATLAICTVTQCVCQNSQSNKPAANTPRTGERPGGVTGAPAGGHESLEELPKDFATGDLDEAELPALRRYGAYLGKYLSRLSLNESLSDQQRAEALAAGAELSQQVGRCASVQELRELLRMIADYNIAVFERYIELGVDGVSFSEDLGSQRALMISPEHFREFIKPEYARIFRVVKDAGKRINFHSCGCVQDIVGDLIDVGVDILNPVQSRANDLHRVKRTVQGRMALQGAIDTHEILMLGTPETVSGQETRAGVVTGYVRDAGTGRPVVGARILVVETLQQAFADAEGRFALRDLVPGVYRLRVEAIGYAPYLESNVVVGSGKPLVLTLELYPQPVALDPIAVRAEYFNPPAVSTNSEYKILELSAPKRNGCSHKAAVS